MDAAAGLSVRPIGGIPVRFYAEARATRASGETELRPAAFAVSDLPIMSLPASLRLRGYAQAGYVGGRYATAFIDGQARIERPIANVGPIKLTAGAGMWGGAQKFAARLDTGPTVEIDLTGTGMPARIAIDYRTRIAGNASPGDGVAVTMSTGF